MQGNRHTPQSQSMPASSPMTSGAHRGSMGSAGGAMTMSDGRRVSLGMGGPPLGLPYRPPFDPAIQEMMAARRASLSSGFDSMDYTGGRRESVDTTTAILDACIQDLTRRRAAMNMNTPSRGPGGSTAGMPNSPNSAAGLEARQNQLRQQQREIEKRQQELEVQRQQLVAGMQESRPPMRPSLPPSPAAGSGGGQGQWWVCQVCSNKAFASHDEAVQHEQVCQGPPRPARYPSLLPPPMASPSGNRRLVPPMHPMGETYLYNQANYAVSHEPVALAMSTDSEWLTPLHCFVRQKCVELFRASESDVANPSKGKRKPIQVGQVGIRCPHCHSSDDKGQTERGSVYYPTTISSIYNATMNLLQRHLSSCPAVPASVMNQYQSLKSEDARSGTSKKYWIESALGLGLIDTPGGIRFLASGPPTATKTAGTNGAAAVPWDAPVLKELTQGPPLVIPDDQPHATAFSYALLGQMQRCFFTEADRLGKRKGLPPGFAGLACRHCLRGYGSGRFFPSSIKTLSDTSKTLNVLHQHMQRCGKCPQDIKDNLDKLREHHDEERGQMKFGSQKAFFARIWNRLHEGSIQVGVKRKAPPLPYMGIPYPPMPLPPMGMAPMAPVNTMYGGAPNRPSMGGLDVLSRQAAATASQEKTNELLSVDRPMLCRS